MLWPPLVAHKDNFITKIKDFLLENVKINFQNCEHSRKLEVIVVNEIVRVISRNYFCFLQKLGKDFPLSQEHDELMEIAYLSSQR